MSGLGQFEPTDRRCANGGNREGFRMPAPARAIDLVQGAGVGKPPMKEPAGKRRAVGRLWGFGVAAASAGDGLPRIAGFRQALRIVDRVLPHLTA